MRKNPNNIENFPIERLTKNWPFSLELAEDLFYRADMYKSFNECINVLAPENDEYSGIETEETDSCYDWFYNDFRIEKGKVYYQKNLNSPKYTLDYIPYLLIFCEALRAYINDELIKNSEFIMWSSVLAFLLYTEFSVLEVLKQEDYIKNNKQDILRGFYYGFDQIEQDRNIWSRLNLKNDFQNSENPKIIGNEKNLLEKKLLNIFLYCEFSRSDSELLINNLFLEKNFKNIIQYYENILFDLFQFDVKSYE